MTMNERQVIDQMCKYPVNVARNIARKQATTKYILMADMDHMFSKNFELKMRNLASRVLEKDPKTVLVYRIFEVVLNVDKDPETKKELYELYKNDEAKEFHWPYFGHRIPRLEEWFENQELENDTEIQFFRRYDTFHWEPQFVSLASIPYHDETFFYPIRDNTVLRWEMCRMSYKFAIVHDVFMYHRSINMKAHQQIRNKAQALMSKKAETTILNFNQRMDKMYPETKNKCPKFAEY